MKSIIPDWARWIARDKSGVLWVYKIKPFKSGGYWNSVDGDLNDDIHDPEDIYSFIKWEDERPWDVIAANMYADSKSDNINKPTHYHKNGIDVIGFAEAQFSKEEQKGFHRINAIKYITRYDRKNGVEDLNKAKFYIDKLIEMEESE